MASLHEDVKRRFMAKRYMDDILIVMRKDGWDSGRFYEDFKASECYMKPLKLEEASDGTFLETSFQVDRDQIQFRLKNVNEGGVKKVWRYQAYDSYTTSEQKWSTLVATLKKVNFMAGDGKELMESAMEKLREFADLGYPVQVRKSACYRVGREVERTEWIMVAAAQL